jgi:hypothetical protein
MVWRVGASHRYGPRSLGQSVWYTFGLGVTVVVQFATAAVPEDGDKNAYQQRQQQREESNVLDANKLQCYLAIQAEVAVASFLLVYRFGGDRPPTPPSVTASVLQRSANARDTVAPATTVSDSTPNWPHTGGPLLLLPTLEEWKTSAGEERRPESSQLAPPTSRKWIQQIFDSSSNRPFVIAFGTAAGVFYTIPLF